MKEDWGIRIAFIHDAHCFEAGGDPLTLRIWIRFQNGIQLAEQFKSIRCQPSHGFRPEVLRDGD